MEEHQGRDIAIACFGGLGCFAAPSDLLGADPTVGHEPFEVLSANGLRRVAVRIKQSNAEDGFGFVHPGAIGHRVLVMNAKSQRPTDAPGSPLAEQRC